MYRLLNMIVNAIGIGLGVFFYFVRDLVAKPWKKDSKYLISVPAEHPEPEEGEDDG